MLYFRSGQDNTVQPLDVLHSGPQTPSDDLHQYDTPPPDVMHQVIPPPLQQLSIGEVKCSLNSPDTTKVTSADDFPTWVSKEGKEDVCIPLHDVINSMFIEGRYPDLWKQAQITPIPKVKIAPHTQISYQYLFCNTWVNWLNRLLLKD